MAGSSGEGRGFGKYGTRNLKARGKRAELALVERLRRAGWSVLRAPASGARSKEPVPDVVAVKKGRVLVFEVKYRAFPRSIPVPEQKYMAIKRHAEQAGGRAYLAVKLKGEDDFRVIPWEEAERTVTTYGVMYVFYKHAIDRARKLTELLAESGGSET